MYNAKHDIDKQYWTNTDPYWQVIDKKTTENDNKPNGLPTKYSIARQKGATGHNQYGNGWNEAGRKRYCDLMLLINKNRAYYNASFDKRMIRYAKMKTDRQKRNQVMKSASKYIMLSEMALPSAESICQKHPDKQALKQNRELMNYNDELSGSEDEDEMEGVKVRAKASI